MNSVEIQPSIAKLWISQMQLVVTSRAQFYKKVSSTGNGRSPAAVAGHCDLAAAAPVSGPDPKHHVVAAPGSNSTSGQICFLPV